MKAILGLVKERMDVDNVSRRERKKEAFYPFKNLNKI
jgi:hypothetical protein